MTHWHINLSPDNLIISSTTEYLENVLRDCCCYYLGNSIFHICDYKGNMKYFSGDSGLMKKEIVNFHSMPFIGIAP